MKVNNCVSVMFKSYNNNGMLKSFFKVVYNPCIYEDKINLVKQRIVYKFETIGKLFILLHNVFNILAAA